MRRKEGRSLYLCGKTLNSRLNQQLTPPSPTHLAATRAWARLPLTQRCCFRGSLPKKRWAAAKHLHCEKLWVQRVSDVQLSRNIKIYSPAVRNRDPSSPTVETSLNPKRVQMHELWKVQDYQFLFFQEINVVILFVLYNGLITCYWLNSNPVFLLSFVFHAVWLFLSFSLFL